MAYPHEVHLTGDTVTIHVECHTCKQPQSFAVLAKNYMAWRQGSHIQDAFAGIPAEQREMLISGICPDCWDKLFGGEDY